MDDGSRFVLSPSLPFVLCAAGFRLDIAHIPYQADLMRFVRGPEGHVGRLPLADGRTVTLIHYRNVEIDEALSMRIIPKPKPPDFHNYREYREYLSMAIKKIVANASAKARRVQYTPLATLSSGYDSTACAALASEAGCREAVTFRTARAESGAVLGPDDSGEEAAKQLGLELRAYDRNDYGNGDAGFPEAEFVACGDLGQDLPWSAFSDAFEGRLVVSGTHGDVVWDRHFKPRCRGIYRKEMSGCSVVEFRSRVGFLYVVPAFFGCWSNPSIARISNSAEMRPWSVAGRYDRPIPRRIAEDKGIRREAFGQRKKAVAVLLNRDGRLDQFMKPESRSDFEQFYQQNRQLRPKHRQAFFDALFAMRRWSGAVLEGLHLSRFIPIPVPQRYIMPPGRPSFLVHWAMPIIQKRYRDALENAKAAGSGRG